MLFTATIAAEDANSSLDGRVFDRALDRGLADLTVTLTPPAKSSAPEAVTLTDKDGNYHLPSLRTGDYLLRIRQGTTLLVRQQIHLDGPTTHDIPLESRKAEGLAEKTH
jgi:hypothetical protein